MLLLKLDTTYFHETPEGIDLELHLAGPIVRGCAWFIDVCIRLLIYTIIATFFSNIEGIGMAITLISIFLVEWFYPVFFEVYRGATPGKKQMSLTVVCDNGTPVSWSASLIRNLLLTIDFAPLLYGFGLSSMLLSQNFKRLGDHAAGTLVIYNTPHQKTRKAQKMAAKIPPLSLKAKDRMTLLNYMERSDKLSISRRIELADILQPITHKEGKEGEETLIAYANWILGER